MKPLRRAPLLLLLACAGAACAGAGQVEDDSDPAIKARVESALRGREDLQTRYVSVDVDQRVVTLSGLVPSRRQSWDVERAAKRTPGVDQVMNNLLIQDE